MTDNRWRSSEEKKELLKKVFELKNTVLEILDWTDIADGRWVSKYENRSIKIKDKETDLQWPVGTVWNGLKEM